LPLPAVKILITDFLEKPASWAGLAWGVKAALKPMLEKEVRYAIQLLARAESIPETVVYTHLGWRQVDGKWT
jgi:hypothetical protein